MTAAVLAIPDGVAEADLPTLLREAAKSLAGGGLVAFPTETVYGLGANALDGDAVARIFAAKGRPADNPLIVHIPDAAWVPRVAVMTPLAEELAARFWPGPLTLVLTRGEGVPDATTAGLETVAVRVPDSPIATALIREADVPVAAPSANRSGAPSPTRAAHVAADLGGAVDWIIDGGPCRVGIESTVVDARGEQPVVLREGAVTREMLGGVLAAQDSHRSPGTRHRHYKPHAKVEIAPRGRAVELALLRAEDGARVGVVTALPPADPMPTPVAPGGRAPIIIDTPADAEALGTILYAAMRRADELGVDLLLIEAVADHGVGRAVMDRLRRAASPT